MADSYAERAEAHWIGSSDARKVMREWTWHGVSGPQRMMDLSCGHTVPWDGEEHFGTGDPFAPCVGCMSEEDYDEARSDEQWGSTCSTGCGWCGACS